MNKSFRVTASHVSPNWCFADHPAVAQPSPGLPGKWYATSERLGCSRDYDTAEEAVKSLFHANACSDVNLKQTWATASQGLTNREDSPMKTRIVTARLKFSPRQHGCDLNDGQLTDLLRNALNFTNGLDVETVLDGGNEPSKAERTNPK